MYNTKEIYKFCTDTSSDDFTINQQRNTDVSITGDININTSEKYFISGGLSAILGKITDNMDFEDTIQDNEKFIDLISSDSEFLLKSPKGHMYIISISDNVSFNFDSVISSYPTTVKFKFSEIVKADDIIINC